MLKLAESFHVVLCVNRHVYPLSPDILGCVEVHHVPFVRKVAPLDDLKSALQLLALIRRIRPQVIHSITPKAGLLAMVSGYLASVQYRWHTFTGQVWATKHGPVRLILKNFDRLIVFFATKIFTDSVSQTRFLSSEAVIQMDQITVLGAGSIAGVDINRYRPNLTSGRALRFSLGTPTDAFVFLFVGRLVRDKGVFDLVNAFNNLSGARVDSELWFVGPDEDGLSSALIALAGVTSGPIRYLGGTSTPEIFMSAADVLVLPSYREGFGSVIIEAAACGIPSIAYGVIGVVDAVSNGMTGLLVRVGDVEALASAMGALATDSERLHRLGAQARERAVRLFNSDEITNAWINYYQSHVLDKSRIETQVMKRLLDIFLAVSIFILASPIFVAVGFFVLLTSPGPAIYWSDRVGQRNRTFKMPKFRTMRVDTPAVATHLLADPEKALTPIGSFLRRSSLDELPQLWSILKGDMSFVGPRPALFNQYDLIELRTQSGVDALVPGLTGWAQVNGRDALSIPDKVQFDLEYLQKRSFAMDIKILYMTFVKVMRRAEVSH
jgi:lipopolysaccharide/colanic/teichoic acid biosynthesis glycosyltransferase